MENVFMLNLRRFTLDRDAGGHTVWRKDVTVKAVPAERAAIVICDMWDNHWSCTSCR